jgi:hypothetical protein
MTKYLVSFPSDAIVLTSEELPVVAAAARAVIEEAKGAACRCSQELREFQYDPQS